SAGRARPPTAPASSWIRSACRTPAAVRPVRRSCSRKALSLPPNCVCFSRRSAASTFAALTVTPSRPASSSRAPRPTSRAAAARPGGGGALELVVGSRPALREGLPLGGVRALRASELGGERGPCDRVPVDHGDRARRQLVRGAAAAGEGENGEQRREAPHAAC